MRRIAVALAVIASAEAAPPDPFAGAKAVPRAAGARVVVVPAPSGTLDRFGDPLPPGAIARFGTDRWHHSGPAHVVFAGPYLVSAGDHIGHVGPTLKLWDATSGRLVATSEIVPSVIGLVADRRGRTVIASSIGGVRVFDLSGPTIASSDLKRARDHVWGDVAITGDGSIAAFVDRSCAIDLDELAGAMRTRTLRCGLDLPKTIAISDDGARVAVGDAEGKFVVLDAASGALVFEHAPATPTRRPPALAFVPGTRDLIEARADQTFARWQVDAKRAVFERAKAFDGTPDKIAVSADGADAALALSAGHSTVAVLRVKDGSQVWETHLSSFGFSVAFDARRVAYSTSDGALVMFDRATGARQALLDDQREPARFAAFLDEDRVATLREHVEVWSIASPHARPSRPMATAPNAFVASATGDRLIAKLGNKLQAVRTTDWSLGRPIEVDPWPRAATPDAGLVALVDFGALELVDTRTMTKLPRLTGAPKATPECVALGADGRIAAVLEHRLYRWDSRTAAAVIDPKTLTRDVSSCAFATNGELVLGNEEGIIVVDKKGAWTQLLRTRRIWNVRPDPRRARVAYADGDGRVGMLDLATRKTTELGAHGAWFVDALAFSPSGNRLLSGARDGAVLVWDVR